MAGLEQVPRYFAFALAEELPLRVWFGATGGGNRPEEFVGGAGRGAARRGRGARRRHGGPRSDLRGRYAKLMADGVLSARTAALLEPYADAAGGERVPGDGTGRPDRRGGADQHRRFPGGHPRDRGPGGPGLAGRLRGGAGAGRGAALPNRIEHIEALHPADAPRFRELGVLASFNPHHCITGIGIYNTDRLGPARAAESFAWGSARDAGAALVFGSDWSTAPLDPLRQLYAATVREKPDGGPPGGWHPRQRVGFREALAAYTLAPARASGWDGEVGSITVGKRADFVVLSGPSRTLPTGPSSISKCARPGSAASATYRADPPEGRLPAAVTGSRERHGGPMTDG